MGAVEFANLIYTLLTSFLHALIKTTGQQRIIELALKKIFPSYLIPHPSSLIFPSVTINLKPNVDGNTLLFKVLRCGCSSRYDGLDADYIAPANDSTRLFGTILCSCRF